MAIIIDRAYLVSYVKSEDTLVTYAQGDEAAITEAIGVAEADALAALRRKRYYTDAALAALTPATAPVDLKNRVAARAIDHLTRMDAGRPDNLKTAGDEASTWFSWVATGSVIVDGLERRKRGGVRGASPERLIFHDDDCE